MRGHGLHAKGCEVARSTYLVFCKFGIVHILLQISDAARNDVKREALHTLYQCFLTLPSVRVGNVCICQPRFDQRQVWYVPGLCSSLWTVALRVESHWDNETIRSMMLTLAISLQLLPASRIVLSRCSSSGLHGVLVRPFFFALDGSAVDVAAFEAEATLALSLAADAIPACCPDVRRFRGFGAAVVVDIVGVSPSADVVEGIIGLAPIAPNVTG